MAPTLLTPGANVPDFELPDHAGGVWRLSEHRGHPVVLVFHRHLA